MKDTLKPGLTHRFAFKVPESKTVPHLYPEAPEFQAMPAVLATGYMVGLMEWTCLQLLAPHMEEGEGRHERFIVKWDRFNARVEEKRARAAA